MRRAAGLAWLVACGSGGGFPDAPAPPPHRDPGTLAIAWTLAAGSASPTCAQVGATTVQIGIVDHATSAQFSAAFPCELGAGVTGALAAATYDLRFELLGSGGVLATGSAEPGVTVSPDQTTTVPSATFEVTPAAALAADVTALVSAHAPALAALRARIAHLQRALHGNPPGWERRLRAAQLANDALGLPPFEQTTPPGPTWAASPASLLGMARDVPALADRLARAHDAAALRALRADVDARYAAGLAQIAAWLRDAGE